VPISIPNVFTDGTTALAEEVNANFDEIADKALDKTGDTITGNITVDGGITIDGVDLSVEVADKTGTETISGAWTFSTNPVFAAGLSLPTTTLTGQMSAADQVIAQPEVKDYAETYSTPSSSAGTLTLNIENGNVFIVTLTENVSTISLANPSATGRLCSITIMLTQDATGSRTVSWPSGVKWPGGVSPTMTTTANRRDIYVLTTQNGGTLWYGIIVGQNYVTS
jgi:hypothetical protein